MNAMRAVLYDRYGPPEVLRVGTVPKPSPGPGEVLVRVRATSVNGGELSARAGTVRFVTGLTSRGFPKPLGIDFTGEVAAVHTPMRGLAVGDRVWGALPPLRGFGAAAEYTTAKTRQLAHAPAGLDLVEAAALPVAATALIGLRDRARLAPGERLLVRGGSGGVGNTAVQLGRVYGAHVTALAGRKNLDLVRELGADEVLDHATTDLRDLDRFDVVFDTVGTQLRTQRQLLTPGGRMVAITFDDAHTLSSLAYIAGSAVHGRGRVQFFSGRPRHDLFAELTRLVDAGALRPVVDTVHALDDVATAHRALKAGGVRGKHVIRID